MTLRRDFLAFTSVAVVAKVVLPTAARAEGVAMATIPRDPDAELLAWCGRFLRADAEIGGLNGTPDEPDAYLDQVQTDWHVALGFVSDTRPRTRDGLRAKAKVTVAAFERDVPPGAADTVEGSAEHHEWAAYQLARDVLAMTGAA